MSVCGPPLTFRSDCLSLSHTTPFAQALSSLGASMAEGLVQCAIAILALCISFACADELPAEHQCPAAGSCQAVGREVPIIDIQALLNSGQHSSADWDKAAEEVAKACEEWGFFQVSCRLPECVMCCACRRLD